MKNDILGWAQCRQKGLEGAKHYGRSTLALEMLEVLTEASANSLNARAALVESKRQ